MNIKEKIQNRIISTIWFIGLILMSPFWWIECLADYVLIKSHKHEVSLIELIKESYFSIFIELSETIQEIKTGNHRLM